MTGDRYAEVSFANVTHVLSWLPPYLSSDLVGFWELRTTSDFAAGEPPARGDWFLHAPRDVPQEHLESWTAETLGRPVSLERGEQELRRGRFFGRWHSEPIFE